MFGLVQTGFQWFGERIAAHVEHTIATKLQAAGQAVVSRARGLAPVDTGFLRSSIDYEVTGRTLTIIVGAPYGIFQEFGTRRIRPHPYIRPALLEMRRVLGTELGMQFVVPSYPQPILAHQGGFIVPRTLTARQRAHVATHLVPVSRRLHRGNVRRAQFRVRRI